MDGPTEIENHTFVRADDVTLEVRAAVESYLSSVEMFGGMLVDIHQLEMDC